MPDMMDAVPGDDGPGRNGPLAGYRILEVGHYLAAPYAGLLLADLGADVIKVETAAGDIARTVGPHRRGTHNLYFNAFNRNKRSVCIDLGTAEGQEQLGRLASTAQGLITNLRPAAVHKLGLTYAALKRWNPAIACVALSGYGLEGESSNRPSYDHLVQALTGLMKMTGEPDAAPTRVGYSVVDNTGGIMGALGLVAHMLGGRGGQVDIALHDVVLSQMNYLAVNYLNVGELPRRYPRGSHPYFVPTQIFATRDGHVSTFITHDAFWRQFAEAVEQPHWADDPRFVTLEARAANREALVAEVAALFATRETEHWVRTLVPRGVLLAPVQDLGEALDSATTRARGMVVDLETEAGPIRTVGNPIRAQGQTTVYRRAPLLGEHTQDLLQEVRTASRPARPACKDSRRIRPVRTRTPRTRT